MSEAEQGTNMDNPEDKQPPAAKELGAVAKNEFAPTIVAGKPVLPAPAPQSKAERRAAKAAAEAAAKAAAAEAFDEMKPREEDFLEYVHGDLKKAANDLGYDLTIKKRNVARGPVMLYHRESLEGKVFGAIEEAGPDYMSGDEYQELCARRAAE